MQISKKSSQNVYDYVVIGSGLTGLCIANALAKISSNVALVESQDSFGGLNRTIQTSIGPTNNGLRFLPELPYTQKAISFLEALLEKNISGEAIDNSPVTYENGALVPFVGFGEKSFDFYEAFSYFSSPKKANLSLEPHEWVQVLFSNYTGAFFPRSFVTKLEVQDNRVTAVTLNGQKTLMGQNFIFTGDFSQLKTLLPSEAFGARNLQKLSKAKFWTAVCLDLVHSQKITDSRSMHILKSTSDEDREPCAGFFHPEIHSENEAYQLSQWVSFIEYTGAEDSENISACLKKIKRQIKRVYPTALDNLKFERIFVAPKITGNIDIKLTANSRLPSLENLWIGSSIMSPMQNILGALYQAELICNALGCHPLGAQVDESALNSEAQDYPINPEPEISL